MRLQTLIKTALRTIQHVSTLVNSIRTFLGSQAGACKRSMQVGRLDRIPR